MPFIETKGTRIGSHGTLQLTKKEGGDQVAVMKIKMPDWSHSGRHPCFEISTPPKGAGHMIARGELRGGSRHSDRTCFIYDGANHLFAQVNHDPANVSHNVYILGGEAFGYGKLQGGPWQFHGDFNGHVVRVSHGDPLQEVGIFEPNDNHDGFEVTLQEGVDIGLVITGLVAVYILEIGGLHRYGFAHI
jgi:hypothetical protein